MSGPESIHATRESREAGQIHGREWKPGDVATVTRLGKSEVAIRADREAFAWFSAHGNGDYDNPRPLVVIDPEDREQVERFSDVYDREFERRHPQMYSGSPTLDDEADTDLMQAALRSLIAPHEPEEPTGLGAVVEDAEGEQWVRTFTSERDPAAATVPWRSADFAGLYRPWSRIAAVRILSPGVDQ